MVLRSPSLQIRCVMRVAALLFGLFCAHAAVAGPVGEVNRHYVDEHRRNWDGNGPRPLETSIWYPAKAAGPAGDATPSHTPFEMPAVIRDAALANPNEKYPLILI